MSSSPKHTVNVTSFRNSSRRNLSFTHSNFYRESDRLRSYFNWPVPFLEPSQLASEGFYYLQQDNDTVRCAFCGVEVGCWTEGDDPTSDHQMWSPNCKFVKKLPCGNIPLESSDDIPPVTVDEAGYDARRNYGIEVRHEASNTNSSTVSNIIPSLEKLSVCENKQPDFPRYSTYEDRMKSYRHWPVSLKLRPNDLSKAGLFYLGRGDQVMCFQCGLGLKDWEDGDDPWIEHARWSYRCNYVRLIKGKPFIDEVCNKEKRQSAIKLDDMENVSESHEGFISQVDVSESEVSELSSRLQSSVPKNESDLTSDESLMVESKQNDDRLCKICFTEEMGVAFLPCGHIVACVQCVSSLTTCAVCRTPFLATARVYLS